MAVCLFGQNREIVTDNVPINGAGSRDRVHNLIWRAFDCPPLSFAGWICRKLIRLLTAPPPDRTDCHGSENSPDDCRGHILLGVPNVALSSEISRAEVRMNNLGDDCFKDFKKTAQGDDGGESEPWQPGKVDSRSALQEFLDWINQQESEAEMNYPVIVIAVEMQQVFHPKPSRHFGVGVMRADRVESQKQSNQTVS